MKHVLTGIRYVLAAVSGLALLLTLLSLVPSTVWWVQALGFPRLQMLVVLGVLLVAWLALSWPTQRRARTLLLAGCGLGLVAQAWFLWPYLPVAPRAAPAASPVQARDSASHLRILVINVWIKNRQADRLRQLVRATRPDVVLALEPDAWWVHALAPLRASYPYYLELPRADAYGLALYSRLPLADTQVQNLLQRGVPSVRTHLRLPNGRRITFWGVHPTPPIPDNYPDGVGLRARALGIVANSVRADTLPTIVAGDYNDVSWSGSTNQLTRTGRLHDVSLGRGLYCSFDANSHLARWPLDHFFVSAPWRVVALKRLPDIGSDHFPMYTELALAK